jgi:hypothetical protein
MDNAILHGKPFGIPLLSKHWTYIEALFKYEKLNEEQIKCVSDCLGSPLLVESTDDGKKSNAEPEAAKEETFLDDNFDEYLASLNYDELALLDAKCESKDNN